MMEYEDVIAGFSPAKGFEVGDEFEALNGGDDLSMDLDTFFDILEEKPDPPKCKPEEEFVGNVLQSDTDPVAIQLQRGLEESEDFTSLDVKPTFFNAKASDDKTGFADDSFNHCGKFEPTVQNHSPVDAKPASFKEWFSLAPEASHMYRVGVSQYEIPSYGTASSFSKGYYSCVPDHGDCLNSNTMENGNDALHNPVLQNVFLNIDSFADLQDCHSEYINAPENNLARHTDFFSSNANVPLHNGTSIASAVSHSSDITGDLNDPSSALPCSMNADCAHFDDSPAGYIRGNFQFQFSPSNNGNMLGEIVEFQMSTGGSDAAFSVNENQNKFPFGISPSMLCPNFMVCGNDEGEDTVSVSNSTCNLYEDIGDNNGSSLTSVLSEHMDFSSSGQRCPSSRQISSNEMQLGFVRDEANRKLINSIGTSKVSIESNQFNSSDCQSIGDDPDIYICEDISQPAPSNQSPLSVKKMANMQHLTFGYRHDFPRAGGSRIRTNDERFLRVALQDLSQPKSEATPPAGALAVPLLRHQRIALAWMVKQETTSRYCSGGILADDQGLGKTVSTIALILKERPPSVRVYPEDVKKVELETLNLDDDENGDGASNLAAIKQESDTHHVTLNGSSTGPGPWVQVKGRPAAGTLIVCPTSVLRQWAEELHNKVTSEANLSVLVYHGSNRTQDPSELAKYDVVLTTYSIVSMEVPKQPSVEEDGDEKGRSGGEDCSTPVLSSSMKRKYPLNSNKKRAKHKKGMDGSSLDSVSRPLAKVGWFRVVLDEAQSIKNHRTQVARACWGLRAKRRWCLSGTPIQNAIDDLYSYFRFLRCDRYAVYKEFCSKIKNEISRNPLKGYSRLQTFLKFVMLRRTKGTLLDGQPIITLPPKFIELKKVEFTEGERDFYSRLESESSAQFKEYEAAGTVKQNYVNILLMLLRLRQACDHPLLVNGFDSNSSGSSSVLVAKNLSREEQISLLRCLQASLALCGICNDPPEDAVVAVCGHVFCNQCICEHLTGDDKQCPTANCKVRLSLPSIFSKATLESTLSEQAVQDISLDCTGPEFGKLSVPCSNDISYDSSKIRAALEVLQSLSKPEGSTSGNRCTEKSSHPAAGELLDGGPDKNDSVTHKSLSGSVKVAGEKAIVFSQWTRMLDLFEVCLKSSSIQYRRLDGTMSVASRDKAVKDFNTLPEVSVIIMSLKAASLGLNMVAACRVILLDLWWNPTTEDQAVDRAHRIGQTRPVTVIRLTVKDTVEDRILALQQKKREMVAAAFGEDESGGQQTRLTVEDLQFLFNG